MNQVELVGKIGAQPDAFDLHNGTKVCKFWVVVPRIHEGAKKKEDNIQCIAFGKRAEFAASTYIKGDRVAITGMLQTHDYTRADCTGGQSYSVVVSAQELLQPRAQSQEEARLKDSGATGGNLEDINYHAPDDLWGKLND